MPGAVTPRTPGFFGVLLAMLGLSAALVAAEDPEAGDYPPGFVATYKVGDTQIERLDADLSFDWGRGPADARLPAGAFEANWESLLLVRTGGNYRFSAYVQGDVQVTLDGEAVLNGSAPQPGWIESEPRKLEVGEFPLKVKFRQTADSSAVHLFWSSDTFPREPIPGHLLFREEGRPDLSQVERGFRELVRGRCQACHEIPGLPPTLPAPDLTSVGWETSADWLIEHVIDPEIDGEMPRYGFDKEQAEDMLALLASHAGDLETPAVKVAQPKEVAAGHTLLHSVGCLACHQIGDHGQAGPYAGPALSSVGSRRTPAWLMAWLKNPEAINASHRMPEIVLTDAERAQIVAAMSQLDGERPNAGGDVPFQSRSPEQAREQLSAAGCANCHQLPKKVAVERVSAPALVGRAVDWNRSCTSPAEEKPPTQPTYHDIDQDAVAAFLKTVSADAAGPSDFQAGAELLERKGCIACHDRDSSKGLSLEAALLAATVPGLDGQAPTLVPPRLTAVGDKLKDDYLRSAIAGRQEKPRLPWLKVRMPRYQHSDSEQAALLAHLIGHDRIPEHPETPSTDEPGPADAATLVAAHDLLGGKGFSCIACHSIGDYEPKNVALGTKGSNLSMLGARMRHPFFLRWVRSPLRIVPGVEMPSYVRPVPGILNADIDRQLEALWKGLHDERLKPPTNPGVVEQYFTVTPETGTRIVRDTFEVARSGKTELIPRSFAAGFTNGHNLLIDLDTLALRGWWFGDFAEQNAVGKSWFWKAAGLPVWSTESAAPLWALVAEDAAPGEGELLLPQPETGSVSRLVDYAQDQDGLTVSYEVHFRIGEEPHRVRVTERFEPVSGEQTGLQRNSAVANVPEGFRMLPIRPPGKDLLGNAAVQLVEPDVDWVSQGEFDVPDVGNQHDVDRWTMQFSTTLPREALELEKPKRDPVVPQPITSTPGFDGVRLPLFDKSIMPTAFTFDGDGRPYFTSLKGHVFRLDDEDEDGLGETLTVIEEGLAAPYGLIFDGPDLLVAQKPEVLRLHGVGSGDEVYRRSVFATGWGFTDNYHDWTCGIDRDSDGNIYVTLGSDYTQPKRPKDRQRWRGATLRIDPKGNAEPIAFGLRYPTGLTVTDDDRVLVSDQQGVQNTFNEINVLKEGGRYGVPSMADPRDVEALPASIQIPHPWTRSVNGLAMIPKNAWPEPYNAFAGHGLGAEYNRRFLIRFSLQEVNGVMQGATYPFSHPDDGELPENFLGPLSLGLAPNGDLYVGSISDSGWSGGPNAGEIVRLRPNGELPNGIREVRATPQGFAIAFIDHVPDDLMSDPERFNVTGYRRIWEGSYATPDSDRHRADVTEIAVDGKELRLTIPELRAGFVYDIHLRSESPLWPSEAYYTLHEIPK